MPKLHEENSPQNTPASRTTNQSHLAGEIAKPSNNILG
jgi:hypothetical protein